MALLQREIKQLKALRTKNARRKDNRFLAEGVRLLEEAARANYWPIRIFYSPAELSERGQALVKVFTAAKREAISVSARECRTLSDTKTSQGILALFESNRADFQQLLLGAKRKIVVCDKIGDPGNLGTLIRSATAFGFDGLITTAGSAEPESPKTIRASMGGYFNLPIVSSMDRQEMIADLKRANFTILNADINGTDISDNFRLPKKLALVIGSEAFGAGDDLTQAADINIKIPMAGGVESLNSAMAGSILMHRIYSGEGN